ncbi:hypothetical protein CXG81DRAFT_26187 [Caulochytrium protostelioides]|uniref:Uncharacterized protein n=1 Tax=Caulochytrium protostelioides TaxID=1555241 RepID=A0A4P9X7D6_9FUNG|nr:hypothetical protein CXG81DRAFT_26187 [Caulochytrium protostelioides]|eukprot:RKP01128.1 hypothetical protein CXG81DRAFT_26187 [Caulochytrium protostelioides]
MGEAVKKQWWARRAYFGLFSLRIGALISALLNILIDILMIVLAIVGIEAWKSGKIQPRVFEQLNIDPLDNSMSKYLWSTFAVFLADLAFNITGLVGAWKRVFMANICWIAWQWFRTAILFVASIVLLANHKWAFGATALALSFIFFYFTIVATAFGQEMDLKKKAHKKIHY